MRQAVVIDYRYKLIHGVILKLRIMNSYTYKEKLLLSQGFSEIPVFGGRRSIVPGPPLSSSCEGQRDLVESSFREERKPSLLSVGNKKLEYVTASISELFKEIPGELKPKLQRICGVIMESIEDMYISLDNLETIGEISSSRVNRQDFIIQAQQEKIDLLQNLIGISNSAEEENSELDILQKGKKEEVKLSPEGCECACGGMTFKTDLARHLDNDRTALFNWAGRAHRRSEASRPRRRPPRKTNQGTNIMDLDLDKNKNLLPQGVRTPSDRRVGFIVPGTCSSSSCVGLAPSSAAGEEAEYATAEIRELEFVDCSSQREGEDSIRRAEVDTVQISGVFLTQETPKIKRKARKSPDAPSPSDDSIKDGENSRPLLIKAGRNLRPRKKRVQARAEPNRIPSSGDSIDNATTDGSGPESSSSKRTSNTKSRISLVISSDEEDTGRDFAPQELSIMGAVDVGALGLESLERVDNMRTKSKNLQGGVSGRMKKELEKAKGVMNTLIYKSEAIGDPTFLKLKNKELTTQIQGLKLKEVLQNKEIEKLQNLIEDLTREVVDLRNRIDEAEDEEKKARRARQNAESKLRKFSSDVTWQTSDKGTDTEDLMSYLPEDVARGNAILSTNTAVNLVERSTYAGSNSVTEPEMKKNDEEYEINSKIKELIKKRAELRKGRKQLARKEDFEELSKEACLSPKPQREFRRRPRIISDVRLVPPRSANEIESRDESGSILRAENKGRTDEDGWKKVASRRSLKRQSRGNKQAETSPGISSVDKLVRNNPRERTKNLRKPPRNAAILVTSQKEGISYADMLKSARSNISLDELQIQATKIRRAANGGLLIEVLGADGQERAKALEGRLKEILQNDAKIVRPTIRGEFRLVGLDDSVTPEEVLYVVAQNDNCNEEDIKIGQIRQMNNGLYTVWVQCPVNAVMKVAKLNKLRIGWMMARVDLLDSRPVQCYKCWRFGHVRLACPAKEDFSGRCFKCGKGGHIARGCKMPPPPFV